MPTSPGKIRDGEHIAIQPYTVLIEVAAAVRRRTGSEELASRVAQDLQGLNSFKFVELDTERARQAIELAVTSGLRGMDAVVVQVAKEFETILVSLDEELLSRVGSTVNTQEVRSLI